MAHAQLNAVLGQLRQLSVLADGSLTDAQLLERFLHQQDEAAFATLVKRHGPLVQKVCWRVLHHVQDAEDAFQATFLVLARNMASIRKRETLASWLHGAAYRTALRAKRDAGRRQYHEREFQRMHHKQPPLDEAWCELQAVLDEETANLPEKYRIVFVLCCLESKSKPEAATLLGLKEGTVSSRLAHARKLMQQRLTRRGLTLSAVLGAVALSETTSPAALPALLVRATAKAALTFRTQAVEATVGISPRIIALAEGVSKTMTIAKFKSLTILVLTLTSLTVAAGVLAQREAVLQEPSAPRSLQAHEKPVSKRNAGKPSANRDEAKAEMLTVVGRVVDPQGKPVAGADVTLWWHLGYEGYYRMWHPRTLKPLHPRLGAVSDDEGRFRFTFSPSEIDDGPMNMWEGRWKSAQVVAAAKGYGPGWALAEDIRKGELTIPLAESNVPIKGRIVDLQGRPVAGARVRVIRLERGGDFIKDFLWQTYWTGLSVKAATDEAGTFTLTGLGAGRKALVVFEGPTIAQQFASLDTSVKADKEKSYFPLGDVVVKPTKYIVGTIRAKDTGKPLAGVVVYGEEDAFRREVRSVTDQNGRYRLVGLPKAERYKLTVYCPESQSYLATFKQRADTEGLKPITADFELRRGIPLAFRMIDKETRQPVRGTVQYTPLQSNPLYHEAEAEWEAGLCPTREFERIHMPDAAGVFHLVAYPGPGIVTAWAKYGRPYLPARPTPAETERYIKGTFMLGGFLELSEGYRVVDTDKSDKLLTFDIELDPGRTVKGSLLGPDSKPVQGATAYGLNYHPSNRRDVDYSSQHERRQLQSADFTVDRLDAREARTISFFHRDRKLIGHSVMRGDENRSLMVRMEPWGALTGSLVDEQGTPLADVRVNLRVPSLPEPGLVMLQEFRTDKEGRFHIEGLVPDLKHELTLNGDAAKKVILSAGDRLKELSVRAGEVKDLGDVLVKRDDK
ncbi:MAG TPA: sigma-70 family RNA polymerase sigma factor [Gemmataceae bacterium]